MKLERAAAVPGAATSSEWLAPQSQPNHGCGGSPGVAGDAEQAPIPAGWLLGRTEPPGFGMLAIPLPSHVFVPVPSRQPAAFSVAVGRVGHATTCLCSYGMIPCLDSIRLCPGGGWASQAISHRSIMLCLE